MILSRLFYKKMKAAKKARQEAEILSQAQDDGVVGVQDDGVVGVHGEASTSSQTRSGILNQVQDDGVAAPATSSLAGYSEDRSINEFDYQAVKSQPVAITGSPASEVAQDIIRRGAIAMPVVVVASLFIGGPTAAAAVAIGISIVLGNFWLSAKILTWASTISHGMVASTSISGYFIRSFVIAGLVWLLKDVSSVNLLWLVFSLVIAHLGLLLWELRYVSTTIAHPGLKPSALGYKPAAGYKKEGVA